MKMETKLLNNPKETSKEVFQWFFCDFLACYIQEYLQIFELEYFSTDIRLTSLL